VSASQNTRGTQRRLQDITVTALQNGVLARTAAVVSERGNRFHTVLRRWMIYRCRDPHVRRLLLNRHFADTACYHNHPRLM